MSLELIRLIFADIDTDNLANARNNVQQNELGGRIKVLDSALEGPLLPLDNLRIERYGSGASQI